MALSTTMLATPLFTSNPQHLSSKATHGQKLPNTFNFRVAVPRSVTVQARKVPNPAKPAKYDKKAPETGIVPAFTRRREVFVGRLAMTGFVSAVVGELITGQGVIGQLRLETGLPEGVLNILFLGVVGFSFLGALSPQTYSEENQRDVAKRPKGPFNDARINPISQPKKFLGVSEFGFTKKNEVFVGRMAMLGFASAIIGEKLTGKGALGQIGIPLNLPLNPEYAGFGLAIWIGFFLLAALGFGNLGQKEGDEDIY